MGDQQHLDMQTIWQTGDRTQESQVGLLSDTLGVIWVLLLGYCDERVGVAAALQKIQIRKLIW